MNIIIAINKPTDIKTFWFNKKIESLMMQGYKEKEITLQLNFFMSESDVSILLSHFRIMKNKIAMSLDTKVY
jgi:hypothetical protein